MSNDQCKEDLCPDITSEIFTAGMTCHIPQTPLLIIALSECPPLSASYYGKKLYLWFVGNMCPLPGQRFSPNRRSFAGVDNQFNSFSLQNRANPSEGNFCFVSAMMEMAWIHVSGYVQPYMQ